MKKKQIIITHCWGHGWQHECLIDGSVHDVIDCPAGRCGKNEVWVNGTGNCPVKLSKDEYRFI